MQKINSKFVELLSLVILDIDECASYFPCDINADCINTNGSYKCICNENYIEENGICISKFIDSSKL